MNPSHSHVLLWNTLRDAPASRIPHVRTGIFRIKGLTRIFHFTCRALSSDQSYDPEYRFRYLTREEITAESGLSRVSERERTYGDRNGDGTYDLIRDEVTVSGKTGYSEQDIILSRKTAP